VAQVNDGKFENYLTIHEGLYSNTVFSMATQQDDLLWIGSFGGVTRLQR
jgi:ligand-binding sensor domain-containing protein